MELHQSTMVLLSLLAVSLHTKLGGTTSVIPSLLMTL